MTDQTQAIRRLLDAFNRRDLEEVLEILHPDCEFRSALGGLEGAESYHGRDGPRRYLAHLQDVFDEYSVHADEVVSLPDGRVLSLHRIRGRGRASGLALQADVAQIWTFRDGRPWKGVGYSDRREALRDAGLPVP